MPLPAGYKVNGSKVSGSIRVPPRVRKITTLLEKIPFGNLLTSMELSIRAGVSIGGAWTSHPCLLDYREKVDTKLFWGSRKSIGRLRQQLTQSEDSNA